MESGSSCFFTSSLNISDTLVSCLFSTTPGMNSRRVSSTMPSLPSVLLLFLGTSEERLNKTLHLYPPNCVTSFVLLILQFIHSVACKRHCILKLFNPSYLPLVSGEDDPTVSFLCCLLYLSVCVLFHNGWFTVV